MEQSSLESQFRVCAKTPILTVLTGFLPISAASIYLLKPTYAIRSVPDLSGHASAYRWRSLPRVRRHRASSPHGSSSNGCCLRITMDQLMCALFSHTHYWYEVVIACLKYLYIGGSMRKGGCLRTLRIWCTIAPMSRPRTCPPRTTIPFGVNHFRCLSFKEKVTGISRLQ